METKTEHRLETFIRRDKKKAERENKTRSEWAPLKGQELYCVYMGMPL